MRITVGEKTLEGLFGGKNTISIPSFQRNYSWTKEQVDQFLLDVYESANSQEPHFWGPIVLLRKDSAPHEVQVIDGQQRITTCVILLSLLRDTAASLQNKMMNVGLESAYDIHSSVRNFLFQPKKYVEPRFTGSYLIQDVLRRYVIADPFKAAGDDGEAEARPLLTSRGAGMDAILRLRTKELRAAYLLMKESLEKRIEGQTENQIKEFIERVFNALTSDYEIHTMELSSEDDAYLLFESLNDRGLRLNPSDLLKTFTLRQVRENPGELSIEEAIDMWDGTVENLGGYDFTKFLRHYLLTQSKKKIQSRTIFREFRSEIAKFGKHGAVRNLIQVRSASEQYARISGSTKHPDKQLAEAFERMNGYSETHRVFLLGVLQSGLALPSIQLLTRAVEYLSFRWIATGGNAQVLETTYQDYVHDLKLNPTGSQAQSIVASILRDAPKDEQVKAVTRSESADLQRYLLRRIESSTGGAIAGVPNIEHLAPQSPDKKDDTWWKAVAAAEKADEDGLVYVDYVNNWGNLTLLEEPLNKSIQNAVWIKKLNGNENFKGISASNYNLNKEVKKLHDWSKKLILEREIWIQDCLKVLLSAEWVERGTANVRMWREK